MADDYYAKLVKDLFSDIERRARMAAEAAAPRAWDRMFEQLNVDVQSKFNEVITTFYSDYDPISPYRRNKSLYQVLEIQEDADSWSAEFIPEKMTAFRNGYNGEDGLYNQVFRMGWHGGADKIASSKARRWGKHPAPGTPYYRAGRGFRRWGIPAAISDTPPLRAMQEWWQSYETNEFDNYLQAFFDDEFEKVREKYGI